MASWPDPSQDRLKVSGATATATKELQARDGIAEGNYRLILANNASSNPLIRFSQHEIQLFKRTIVAR